MEELLNAISNVGFPIAVAVYILIRIEPRLNKLSDGVLKLIPIIEEDTANTKEVKTAINCLKIEIAKLSGKK